MSTKDFQQTNGSLKQNLPLILTFIVGTVIWFSPGPEVLTPQAWHCLAIFVATIFGIITKALPMGAIAILALGMSTITGTLKMKEALASYQEPAIWIIVVAFFISRGFIKTRLGTRIAYYFVKFFGKSSLGLAYSFSFSELVLAPAIPSVTARAGGIILPIVSSLARALNSRPNDPSARNLGSYIMLVCFQASVIASAMFLTAMAANPIVVSLAAGKGILITWGIWAKAAIVPGLISLLVMPIFIYMLCPPKIKKLPDAHSLAVQRLKEMGSLSKNESIMLGVFGLIVILWIFGDAWKINAVTTAFLGVSILLATRVLEWSEFLEETNAWETFVWFGALLTLASQLNKLGVIEYFSEMVTDTVAGMPWVTALVILSLMYFYSHYFFASSMAHVSAMFPAFVAVAIVLGAPPLLSALILGFFSNLYGGITHYSIGSAPIFFGTNYVGLREWWKVGLLMSFINITIWLGIGGIWWKCLGFW